MTANAIRTASLLFLALSLSGASARQDKTGPAAAGFDSNRQLLTHVAGLRPDVDLTQEWQGYDRAIELAVEEVPTALPGERFIYSDIGFFLLGDIVRRVSGTPLDVFVRQHLFEPLGMKDTMFRPPERLRPRIAPTERCAPLAWPCNTLDAPVLRGIVHDPTARRMGGVAGHAGLFGTASDLARFCRML